MEKIKFTKSSLEKLSAPSKKTTYQDVDTRYLHFVITPKDTRTYYYIRKVKGRPKYIKIANYGDVSIKAAQERVSQINTDVMYGVDTKQKEKENITLEEAFEYWLSNREKIKGWHRDILSCKRRFCECVPTVIKRKKIIDLKRSEVRKLHSKVCDDVGLHSANRLLQSIRASINLLIKHDYNIPQNPAAKVDLFQEKSRERFIKEDEVERFFAELIKSDSEDFKDFVLIALFTSKRKNNVLAAEWSEIDFKNKLWTIPREKTKNRESDVTVLDDIVLDVFIRRKKDQQKKSIETNWVFYSKNNKSGHYTDPWYTWRALLKRANIKDLRIHDLRRTLASWMANQNVSLHMIASVLGQKSTGVTPTYARLSVDPKRKAVSNAVAEILKVGKLKLGENGLESDNVRKRVQVIAEKLLENPELVENIENALVKLLARHS